MPAQIWRTSLPMSTVNFNSLSAPAMRSAVLIWPTRISTFAKSSMPIFSRGRGRGGSSAPPHRCDRSGCRGWYYRRRLLLFFAFPWLPSSRLLLLFQFAEKCFRLADLRAGPAAVPHRNPSMHWLRLTCLTQQPPYLSVSLANTGCANTAIRAVTSAAGPENCLAGFRSASVFCRATTDVRLVRYLSVDIRDEDQISSSDERESRFVRTVPGLHRIRFLGPWPARCPAVDASSLGPWESCRRNFLDHGSGAAGKIAEAVGQIAVITLD